MKFNNLKYDFMVDLATAHSRISKKWHNRHWQWSELLERCSETKRTGETAAEYARMSREEQSNVKDVGGFVGGYLSGGIRKGTNVLYRSVATLDIDYGTENVWDDFTMAFNFAAMLYSTHKHSKEHPRYRLVFPLDRQVTPAEYEPLCRKIAAELGIDLFDDTTYELPRLFYWPSTSKDADFVFEYQDGPACGVDKILSQYVDPFDVSAWPMSSRENTVVAHEIKKAGDPTEKPGLIGAFCRAYTIEEAVERFLSGCYEPTSTPGRYTYKLGSVAGGLVCYEHKFAYSHHETDPSSRQLCNAFDLCRIHLYGAKDEGSRATDVTRKPSFAAMQEMAAADKNVKLLMARERSASAADDFGSVEVPEDYSDEWKAELEYAKSGSLLCSMRNIILILENDPGLKGRIARDVFGEYDAVRGGLPWDKDAFQWRDRDDSNLRAWMEMNYGITGKDKIKDAVNVVTTKYRFDPVREYLEGLSWDGVPRLERLVIDYLGAEDSELNRAMTRMQFTAAVKRVFQPGCKHDYCLILAGPEGCGKSTLLNKMGGRWFNDSIITLEGKDGRIQLSGSWIVELGELDSMRRSETTSIKTFLSCESDNYRAPYESRPSWHPRRCVFFGTTNEEAFLKGDTGNRRFWVMAVDPALRKYRDWYDALDRDRDQLWAEAVEYFRRDENTRLDDEMEALAKKRQEEYNDDSDDPMVPLLLHFLDMKLPADWDTRSIADRRRYINDPDELDAAGVVQRDRVCVMEFVQEQLGKNAADKDVKYLARRVKKLIRQQPDWEEIGLSKHAGRWYGAQRSFKRIKTEEDEDEI